jgi:DNA-3-methyladenine glycosylase II
MTSPIASPETLAAASQHLASVDPHFAPLIAHYGIPTITPHTNYYQELVESIISQQLSVKAAATILKRFVALFGDSGFPSPDAILTKDVDTYRSVGLSRQKATYIQDLAVKVIEGTVVFDHLDRLTNDEIMSELTQIKGVGVWTVHMFLIFCMGRLDVLPVGDLGIKNGFKKVYELSETPTPETMESIATQYNWGPYESVASWYLWRSLENMPVLEAV